MDPDTEMPSSHALSDYEGPMKAALQQRYLDMGERLKGITKDTLGNAVYFKYDPTKPTLVQCGLKALEFQVSYSDAVMRRYTDWEVQEGRSLTRAILFSKVGKKTINLYAEMVEGHNGMTFPDEHTPFNYPTVGDAFMQRLKNSGINAPLVQEMLAEHNSAVPAAVVPKAGPPVATAVPTNGAGGASASGVAVKAAGAPPTAKAAAPPPS